MNFSPSYDIFGERIRGTPQQIAAGNLQREVGMFGDSGPQHWDGQQWVNEFGQPNPVQPAAPGPVDNTTAGWIGMGALGGFGAAPALFGGVGSGAAAGEGAAAGTGVGAGTGAAAGSAGSSAIPSWVGPAVSTGRQLLTGGGTGGNMQFLPGGGGSAERAQQGGGLFDNLLGTVGNLSPALLAGYLGNSQRQDVMGQVGRINDVAGGLSGPAFMQSITNPYDLQTGQGRTALSQSLQQRGVGGSSFGNQQLGNYDYQRGLGRGDLATRAAAGIAGTQGQLYSNALHGIVGGNAAYNSLLGAGLGASGSLFNRPGQTGLGGLGNIGNSLGGLFGTGVDQTTDPYAGNPGGQVDFGNDPSLGASSTSGNGLFDWLGQNGGDYGLNF